MWVQNGYICYNRPVFDLLTKFYEFILSQRDFITRNIRCGKWRNSTFLTECPNFKIVKICYWPQKLVIRWNSDVYELFITDPRLNFVIYRGSTDFMMHLICRTQGGSHIVPTGWRDLCSSRPPNLILVLKEAQANFPHMSQHFYLYRKVFLNKFAFAKKALLSTPPPLSA